MDRLFFIDDDANEHLLFSKIIREVSVTTECLYFLDSAEALSHMQKHSIRFDDLVVLDLNMPLIDGKELLKKMRELLGKQFPVLLIQSNSIADEDIWDTQRLGARFYLQKRPYHETIVELRNLFAFLQKGRPLPRNSKMYSLVK